MSDDARRLNIEYEKIYTKEEVALDIISCIQNIEQYDLIIDPFAGSGSFSRQIKGGLGYDIMPDHPSIIEKDFFTFEPFNRKVLIITWTPYGRTYDFIIKFVKHLETLNVYHIGILFDPNMDTLFRFFKPIKWKLLFKKYLGNDMSTFMGESTSMDTAFFLLENRSYKDL